MQSLGCEQRRVTEPEFGVAVDVEQGLSISRPDSLKTSERRSGFDNEWSLPSSFHIDGVQASSTFAVAAAHQKRPPVRRPSDPPYVRELRRDLPFSVRFERPNHDGA